MRKLIALLIASILPTQGALTFGGATTDRVNVGSASNLDNLTAFTVLMWVYPTSTTNDKVLISKYRGSTPEGWNVTTSGTSGDIQIFWERATTDLNYITSSTPLATANTWKFIAVAVNQTGPSVNLYKGDLTTSAAAATFGTSTGGSGSFTSDAARSVFIGNRDAATPNAAWVGRIDRVMLVNREMTAGEIQGWQFRPRAVSGTIGFWTLGSNGAGTQPDLSGNANSGTVTGATQSDFAPLGSFFGFDWRDATRRLLGLYA